MIDKSFILAGRAIFTLEIPAHFQERNEGVRPHYTFKITKKEASESYQETFFIWLLTGPDNTRDYTYVGKLVGCKVVLTSKSRYTPDSWPVRLLRRILLAIWAGNEKGITESGFDLHHEGRCCRCGRVLTTPASCSLGIGPECAGKI